MFETVPNPGTILGMLLIVILLGLAIYAFGAIVMAFFRRGRLEEETDIAYPAEPQSETDQRAVDYIHERDERAGSHIVDADEEEVGGRRRVRQSPTQAERPVDRADRNDDDPADYSSRPPL
jgi:hypothetical protein